MKKLVINFSLVTSDNKAVMVDVIVAANRESAILTKAANHES